MVPQGYWGTTVNLKSPKTLKNLKESERYPAFFAHQVNFLLVEMDTFHSKFHYIPFGDVCEATVSGKASTFYCCS